LTKQRGLSPDDIKEIRQALDKRRVVWVSFVAEEDECAYLGATLDKAKMKRTDAQVCRVLGSDTLIVAFEKCVHTREHGSKEHLSVFFHCKVRLKATNVNLEIII
jgi:RNA-binding protein YhbY